MSSTFEKEMRHAVEFIPNRLYYVALSQAPPNHPQRHYYCIDNEMIYWNFYLDFGPLNLGHVYRYGVMLNNKLNDHKLQDKVIFHYSHTHAHRRANAAFLICSWALLHQNKLPDDAFKPFRNYVAPFPPWHDATPSPCSFNLTILDTLRGLHKAREYQFFDFKHFDIHEYEFYEQVENGDLNWCLEKKFLAFAGPHAERQFSPGGYHTLRPEDYIQYFLKKNVTLVVRLNKPYYEAKKFINHGIGHLDLYFLDGSNPTEPILQKFLTKSEETPGAVAVHCKAGLGRTGSCIAAYMMKHYRITAEEVIGWLRIVRPGSVIGPQQQYVKDIQMKMWAEGELMRARLTQSSLPMVTTHSSGNNHAHGTTTASGKVIAASANPHGAYTAHRGEARDQETNSLRCSSNSGKYSPSPGPALYLGTGSGGQSGGTSSQSSRPNTSGSGTSGGSSSSTLTPGLSPGMTPGPAHSPPQSASSSSSPLGITRKLSKVQLTSPVSGPVSGPVNSSPGPAYSSNTPGSSTGGNTGGGRPLTPKTSMHTLHTGIPTPTTPVSREGLRTPPLSTGGYTGGPSPASSSYLRPSSRGQLRPSTSSGKYGGTGTTSGITGSGITGMGDSSSSYSSKTTASTSNEEESGGITQGDQLRIRRAQHNNNLQTTGVYTLQTQTSTGNHTGNLTGNTSGIHTGNHTGTTTGMMMYTPSTPTGSSMASKMFGGGSPSSASSPMSPGGVGGGGGNMTPTSASGSRPKSRLGSLLSSWK